MKLIKVETLYVPVSVNSNGLAVCYDEENRSGWHFSKFVEEQNNKFILSEDELGKVVSDAIQFGIRKQSSFEIGGGKNVKLIDLTNEFSKQILNKQ